MLRRVRVGVLSVVVVAAAGCGTYRQIAPLDEAERAELESLRLAFADRTIVLDRRASDTRIARALRQSGFNVSTREAGDAAVGPRVEYTGESGGALPTEWGLIFGIFVIPVWTNGFAYDFRISDGAREVPCECTVGVPIVYGWLALPLLLLPRWEGWDPIFGTRRKDHGEADPRIALTIARSVAAVETPE